MSLINAFGETVTVSRPVAGSWVAGAWVDGARSPETLTITASVQPLKGRELLDLPEAERTREWVKAYASSEIRTADEREGRRADVLTWRGNDYQVRQVETWEVPGMAIAPYWKALACRIEPDEVPPNADP